jgi:hypothetical protein
MTRVGGVKDRDSRGGAARRRQRMPVWRVRRAKLRANSNGVTRSDDPGPVGSHHRAGRGKYPPNCRRVHRVPPRAPERGVRSMNQTMSRFFDRTTWIERRAVDKGCALRGYPDGRGTSLRLCRSSRYRSTCISAATRSLVLASPAGQAL